MMNPYDFNDPQNVAVAPVSRLHIYGFEGKIRTTIRWIAMKYGRQNHVAQWMNCNISSDP